MKTFFERMSELLAMAAETLWSRQVVCQGCGDRSGADEDYLCVRCADRLKEIESASENRCLTCGNPAEAKCICKNIPHVTAARYSYYYQKPVSGIIQHLKYSGVTCMAEWMAERMYETLLREDWLEDVHAIVPVPMPPKRQREREYNQAELLAEALAKATNLPMLKLLERTGETPRQVRLSGRERRENVKNAFRAVTDAKGLTILLVDDVRTTGATIDACAQALLKAGAGEVLALTFAAVSRPVEEKNE